MAVIKTVEKLWGREEWHHNDRNYCMKTLLLYVPGAISSLHYHKMKHKTFLVIDGEVDLYLNHARRLLKAGDAVDIHAGEANAHSFRLAPGCEYAMVVEASTFHDDADVVRIEPSHLL